MTDTDNQTSFAPRPQENEPWDVAIIGSGPSGLTAAIYTTRGAASTVIFGGENWGGQLMLTTTVDNFPAHPGIQGPDLMGKMLEHAKSFGAEFLPKKASEIEFLGKEFKITADMAIYRAKSLIIATGADTRWLGVEGEKEMIGRGVSSCAPCDAPFFKDKKVMVVGGGDSAMEEALVLTKYASHVTIVHRRDAFRASAAMQNRVMEQVAAGKIDILWNSEITAFKGGDKLESVMLKNSKDGSTREMLIDGVFVAIGHLPATDIFKDKLELDEKGYIKKVPSEGYQMTTSVPGVFVAGDVHDTHYRQAITAAGFGCMAGMEVLKFLDKPAPSY